MVIACPHSGVSHWVRILKARTWPEASATVREVAVFREILEEGASFDSPMDAPDEQLRNFSFPSAGCASVSLMSFC